MQTVMAGSARFDQFVGTVSIVVDDGIRPSHARAVWVMHKPPAPCGPTSNRRAAECSELKSNDDAASMSIL
jgi:hypothetical protein